jgi:hydroxymethylbilane synthase
MLSRASPLARLQAALVERALKSTHPSIDIDRLTRTASGDQDQTLPLWKFPDKGAFTADLSKALLEGAADFAVHSFKDLPVEMPAGTRIAGALPRADARDVVLIRRTAIDRQPSSLRLLSSSPRRAWLLGDVLPRLLPWRVTEVDAVPVRGNIETRLRKLVEGDEHGLVMAKAALDRLLGFGPPFDREAAIIRERLAQCRFMVMPMRECPWAPAQGAIAIEIADSRTDLQTLLQPIMCAATLRAADDERRVLAEHGGGCHQALGAAIVDKQYGRVVSVRARDKATALWELRGSRPSFPRAAADRVWPSPGMDLAAERRTVQADQPVADGYWVSRAEALPDTWSLSPDTFVWAAGSQTWQRLAARGIWVHGCADGLGDDEQPPIELLAGRTLAWIRLTHAGARMDDGVATYVVETQLPEDLPTRTHFYWTSGDLFSRALHRWPSLRNAWHASGPGRTRDAITTELGSTERIGVWLDRASWERDVCL